MCFISYMYSLSMVTDTLSVDGGTDPWTKTDKFAFCIYVTKSQRLHYAMHCRVMMMLIFLCIRDASLLYSCQLGDASSFYCFELQA